LISLISIVICNRSSFTAHALPKRRAMVSGTQCFPDSLLFITDRSSGVDG
jgi:hypothetical protein